MKPNQFIYQNRTKFRYGSGLLIILGAILSYVYFDIEPWETIGGFICGLGFGLLLIFVGIKAPKTHED